MRLRFPLLVVFMLGWHSFLLFPYKSIAQEGQGFNVSVSCGTFCLLAEMANSGGGQSNIDVRTPPDASINFRYQENKAGRVFELRTGAAAQNSNPTREGGSRLESTDRKAAQGRILKIFKGRELIGGMFEILQESGIFIGNRHVLQGLTLIEIQKSFDEKNSGLLLPTFSGYRFFEFRYPENDFEDGSDAPMNSQRDVLLDAVVAIPVSKLQSFNPSTVNRFGINNLFFCTHGK